MNRLRQFWHGASKVFDLPRRLRGVRDGRADPQVPTSAVNATLFLGALLRKPLVRAKSHVQAPPRPNPSVEARPNGVALGPPAALVHHASSGPSTTPSAPPHLER